MPKIMISPTAMTEIITLELEVPKGVRQLIYRQLYHGEMKPITIEGIMINVYDEQESGHFKGMATRASAPVEPEEKK
jgi:hypothetical protein